MKKRKYTLRGNEEQGRRIGQRERKRELGKRIYFEGQGREEEMKWIDREDRIRKDIVLLGAVKGREGKIDKERNNESRKRMYFEGE